MSTANYKPPALGEITKALDIAHCVTQRAVEILKEQPFGNWIEEDSSFELFLNEDDATATLYWSRVESGYDNCRLEEEQLDFPAHLLTLNDVDLKAWQKNAVAERKAQEKAKREAERVRRRAIAAAQAEAQAAAKKEQVTTLLRDGVVVLGKRYKLVQHQD